MRNLSLLIAACLVTPFGALAAPSTLLGRWNCESPGGPGALDFRDNMTVIYAGKGMAYRVQGNVILVVEDGVPASYQFALQGDRLDIQTPDGELIRCARDAGRPAPAAPKANAAGGPLDRLLQGQFCSWSGSSGGGSSYSTTQRVFFDGRGHYTTGSESSFGMTSRDAGGNETGSAGAYGSGEGAGGTYAVTAARPGSQIRVKWNTGEDDVAYVHFVSGGRITEIKYGDKVFGAALCE